MKCNGNTKYNQPKKPNIFQVQLTIVVQASAHVHISFLININFKDQPCNFFCEFLDTNTICHVKLIKKHNESVKSKWL